MANYLPTIGSQFVTQDEKFTIEVIATGINLSGCHEGKMTIQYRYISGASTGFFATWDMPLWWRGIGPGQTRVPKCIKGGFGCEEFFL